MYQLPRGLGSFNGLTGLCISVGCVVLGVLWRFCRPVVMVFIVVMGVAYIFLDQRVTYHVQSLNHLIISFLAF